VIGRDAPTGQQKCQLWQASFAKTAQSTTAFQQSKLFERQNFQRKEEKQ
jgi:hypothetical protein